MFVHHIVTISLMSLSWSNNFVRIGTLVLVVHDAVDYWLEVSAEVKVMSIFIILIIIVMRTWHYQFKHSDLVTCKQIQS